MSLENIKISRKLIFAFSLLILIAIIQSLVILYSVNTVTTDNKTRTETSDAVLTIEGVGKDMIDLSGQVRGFLLTRDEAFAKGVAADYARVKEAMTKLSAIPHSPAEQAALTAMQDAIDGYMKNVGEPQIALARDPATLDKALEMIRSGINKEWMDKFKLAQDQFLDLSKKQLDELRINFNASLNLVWYGVIIGGVISVIIAFAMSMVLQSQIAKPIIAIAETMRRLAGGDTSVTIPSTDRRDEIGEMAQAVQVFKQMADSERTGAAAEQAAAMSQLAAGLKKLAAGDLSNTLSEGFSATYAQIRNDFNEALTRLKETISTVLSRTHSIETGTREISSAADDLSKRTEQQAASLEETAAALEEITATVKRTAANAKEAGQIVDGAKQAAEDGGRIVGTAIAAMNQIEQSSKQITDIIGVIDEIAFQTNLLALNAGVEAARAGEAGRGFAVVASEVRALAQRSSEAAKQIKSLIKASGEHVGSGVKLVDETGKSLNGIVAQVLSIASLVKEIAQAAEQQSSGIEEVNVAVSQMDQATQQNAAMVEQSTAACRNLSAETAELSELISVFNIGSETVGRQPLRARNEISARPAAPRLLTPQRRAGNTALATKAAPAEDWQEF